MSWWGQGRGSASGLLPGLIADVELRPWDIVLVALVPGVDGLSTQVELRGTGREGSTQVAELLSGYLAAYHQQTGS